MRAGGTRDRGVRGRHRGSPPTSPTWSRCSRPASSTPRSAGAARGSASSEAAAALLGRRVRGKAVLEVGGMTLAGRRVVVVGGTSGMGLATVRAAAAQGAEVVAAGRRPVEDREPVDGVRQAQVDVTDEASVRALFDGSGRSTTCSCRRRPARPGPFLEQDLAAARTLPRRQAPRQLDVRALRGAADAAGRVDHLRDRRARSSARRATPRWSRRRSPPSRRSRARSRWSSARCA